MCDLKCAPRQATTKVNLLADNATSGRSGLHVVGRCRRRQGYRPSDGRRNDVCAQVLLMVSVQLSFDLKLGEREGLLRFRLEKEYNRSCVEVGANHS